MAKSKEASFARGEQLSFEQLHELKLLRQSGEPWHFKGEEPEEKPKKAAKKKAAKKKAS